MRPLLQRLTLLSLLAVACGFCVPAMGQQPADPILAFVGEWDLPGTPITIGISKNHYVLHSKLGRGDIRWDNADYFEVSFREHSLKCHYIIRLYSQNELSVVRGEQLDPPECDLGELRRARGSELRDPKGREDAVPASPPHAIAGKEPSLPATVPAEAAKSADVIQDCKDCPEVVLVSGGFFAMGSPDSEAGRRAEEGPVHRVGIKKFGMGRYAVTRKQYMAFVEETGYSQGKTCRIGDGKRIEDRIGYSYLNPGFPQDEAHPVVCVNWYDAIAYVSWLSKKTGKAYRLPSEAEREYATRAGAATPYSFGASVSTAVANYDAGVTPVSAGGEAGKGTTPVASFAANAFGLYQMHGNVAEWTQDCWNQSYDSAPGDGSALASGDCSKRPLRGGAFAYSAAEIRSAYREAGYAQDRYAHVGFRVAREETQ
jgi:formylglycine-generating enzyme required for sulfatase activity